jgi:hypothetical protein
MVKNIPGLIPTWTKPIIMAFHAGQDKQQLNLNGKGETISDKDIHHYAASCFGYAASAGLPVYLTLKQHDSRFKEIFESH